MHFSEQYEDMEYMTRKLMGEFEKWCLNISFKNKENIMTIGSHSKYSILGDGIGQTAEKHIWMDTKRNEEK